MCQSNRKKSIKSIFILLHIYHNAPGCGKKIEKKKIGSRIVGGKIADPNEWPWLAAIVSGSLKLDQAFCQRLAPVFEKTAVSLRSSGSVAISTPFAEPVLSRTPMSSLQLIALMSLPMVLGQLSDQFNAIIYEFYLLLEL